MNRISTAAVLALTALAVQAGDTDLYSESDSSYDRITRRMQEIENYGGSSRGGAQVVVPIPPSDRGVTYYGPNIMGSQQIRTPTHECLFTPQGGNCIPK